MNQARKDATARNGGEADEWLSLDAAMSWAANIIIVAVLPTRLGLLGAPLWFFLAYAAVAGCVLALSESLSHARDLFFRSDVRAYLLAWVVIVAVGGLIPFAIGGAFR